MKFVLTTRAMAIICIFFCLAISGSSSAQENAEANQEVMASNIQLSNNEKYIFNDTTHVRIAKIVNGNSGYPEFAYKINIPKVDDFEFILALDSSGSFLDGGQANAVRGAVPKFIKGIQELHSDMNFNVNIMSWDEDIDFVYPVKGSLNPFRDNRTDRAEFINVTQASYDIETYRAFALDNSEYYYTKEEEFTDLNQPIKSSLDIFNRIPVKEFNRTSRFIILVTGRGEFSPVDSDLIEKAQEKNLSIYVIGMDLFGRNNNLTKSLMKLASNDSLKYQALPEAATPDDLEKDLLDALLTALNNAIKEPVAKNLTIVEPFYDYVHPNEDKISILELVTNSSTNEIEEIHPRYQFSNILENGNMTRKVTIGLIDELMPNSETTIKYSANLDIKNFPLLFSRESIDFFNRMANIDSKPNSHISYVWLKKFPVYDSLPDIPIDISMTS